MLGDVQHFLGSALKELIENPNFLNDESQHRGIEEAPGYKVKVNNNKDNLKPRSAFYDEKNQLMGSFLIAPDPQTTTTTTTSTTNLANQICSGSIALLGSLLSNI